MSRRKNNGRKGADPNRPAEESGSDVVSEGTSPHEEDRTTNASDGEREDRGGAPATPSAATQKVPATGTDSFAEELDMEKISPSIREEYFTVERNPDAELEESDLETDENYPESELSGETEDEFAEENEGLPVEIISPDLVLVVQEINAMARDTVESGAVRIGRYILENVFENRLEDALSKDPYKKKSFAAICGHSELRVDPRRLGEWVRVAAFTMELEAEAVELNTLTFSHKLVISKVQDGELRLKLAQEAYTEKLSVSQTEELVRKRLKGDIPMAGLVMKKIKDRSGLMKDEKLLRLCEDKDGLKEELDANQRMQLIGKIGEAKKRAAEARKLEEDYLKLLGELEERLVEIELESRTQPEE
jgi:hypothetical protein